MPERLRRGCDRSTLTRERRRDEDESCLRMRERVLTSELMDDPAIPAREHARALRGLRRLNIAARSAAPVVREVRRLLGSRANTNAPASIVDIATGGGDLLLALARGLGLGGGTLTGLDVSTTALDVARERARAQGINASWLTSDVVNAPLPMADASVDVAVCSLFLHHLREDEVVRVLREMARVSRMGVVVSDLERSGTGLLLAFVAGRILTRSRVVHVDSVRSVRAGWRARELASLAARAGMAGARVARVWPARLLLTWERTP